MRLKKSGLFVLLLSLCLNQNFSLYAQEKNIPGEEFNDLSLLSLQELLDIQVSSASKQNETVAEAPSILSVIPANQIRDYGWLSCDEILNKLPGFFQSHDYERHTVGSRGLFEGWNNNHLLMLIDGVPFNDNQYGSAYTWEITPLYFTKSVEVLRGPGSALYGSNATNGVVAINTLSAADLDSKTRASVRIGNFGTRKFDVITGTSGNYFSAVLSYTGYKTDGNEYDSYDDSFRQGRDVSFPEKYRVQDNRAGHYVFGKLEGMKALQGLVVQYHYQYWEYETGHGWLWMVPTIPENMVEQRHILSVKYKPETESKLKQEYVLRWQEHNINWNIQESPPEAWDGIYSQGMIEYLNTTTRDIFGRAQFTYFLNENKASLMGGIEATVFYYDNDEEEHYSNILLDQDAGADLWKPNENNQLLGQQAWYEWIDGKPVTTIATYAQYSSGKIFDGYFKFVGGLRYDTQFFKFTGIDKENDPEEKKSFSQLSPRLGILFFPSDNLVIKALYGRAFRIPAPSEMFGANTWTLSSAIRTIEPEIITTHEIAIDYKINENFNLKLNGYYTKFENQAAYGLGDVANITNIYTSENAGLEAELVFAFSNNISGFANYSYVTRLAEEIAENQREYIAESDRLTWAPGNMFNLGILYRNERINISAQLKYQGKVYRRDSDSGTDIPEYASLRPESVADWISVDARIAYMLTSYLELNLNIKNLFNRNKYIIKNFDYPFDYKMAGRKIQAGVSIRL